MQKPIFVIIALLIMVILAGCSRLPNTTPIAIVPTARETLSPFATARSTVVGTAILPLATSNTAPPTTTLTPVDYSFSQIRIPSETDGRIIWTIFWSQDGSLIYYALVKDYGALSWFALDISDRNNIRELQLLSAPRIAYSPKPLTDGLYDEYRGLISPSGRYRMRIISDKTLFIYDTVSQLNYKVLEGGMNFRGAYWAKREDKVIFGIGPEYGTYIYLYDITQQNLIETNDLLGFHDSEVYDPETYEWVPSPDGKHIALLDRLGMRIISLEDKSAKVIPSDRQFQNLRWSGDSKRVYFFYGNPGEYDFNFQVLGFYDVSMKTFGDVIELSRLNEFIKSSFFDVSPDGKQFAFWRGSNIWLLALH